MQPDISNIPLRDIHLPDPVSWWPPALGWWLLLSGIVLSAALIVWHRRRRRMFKLRNIAMSELDAIYQSYKTQHDVRQFVRDLSTLLRRICISYFPNNDTAGLIGKAWLVYLDSLLSSKHNKSGQKFSDGVGEVLVSAPYQYMLKHTNVDADALYELCTEWIYSLGPVRRTKSANSSVRKEVVNVSV